MQWYLHGSEMDPHHNAVGCSFRHRTARERANCVVYGSQYTPSLSHQSNSALRKYGSIVFGISLGTHQLIHGAVNPIRFHNDRELQNGSIATVCRAGTPRQGQQQTLLSYLGELLCYPERSMKILQGVKAKINENISTSVKKHLMSIYLTVL